MFRPTLGPSRPVRPLSPPRSNNKIYFSLTSDNPKCECVRRWRGRLNTTYPESEYHDVLSLAFNTIQNIINNGMISPEQRRAIHSFTYQRLKPLFTFRRKIQVDDKYIKSEIHELFDALIYFAESDASPNNEMVFRHCGDLCYTPSMREIKRYLGFSSKNVITDFELPCQALIERYIRYTSWGHIDNIDKAMELLDEFNQQLPVANQARLIKTLVENCSELNSREAIYAADKAVEALSRFGDKLDIDVYIKLSKVLILACSETNRGKVRDTDSALKAYKLLLQRCQASLNAETEPKLVKIAMRLIKLFSSIDCEGNMPDADKAIQVLSIAKNILDAETQANLLTEIVPFIQKSISIDLAGSIDDATNLIKALALIWDKLKDVTRAELLTSIVPFIQKCMSIDSAGKIYDATNATKTLALMWDKLNDVTRAELLTKIVPFIQKCMSIDSAGKIYDAGNAVKAVALVWDKLDAATKTELTKDIVPVMQKCMSIDAAGNIYDAGNAVKALALVWDKLDTATQAELARASVPSMHKCMSIDPSVNIYDAENVVKALTLTWDKLDAVVKTELAKNSVLFIQKCISIDSAGNFYDAANAIKILNLMREKLDAITQAGLAKIIIQHYSNFDFIKHIHDKGFVKLLHKFWHKLDTDLQAKLANKLAENILRLTKIFSNSNYNIKEYQANEAMQTLLAAKNIVDNDKQIELANILLQYYGRNDSIKNTYIKDFINLSHKFWHKLDLGIRHALLKRIVLIIEACTHVDSAGNFHDADTAIYALTRFSHTLDRAWDLLYKSWDKLDEHNFWHEVGKPWGKQNGSWITKAWVTPDTDRLAKLNQRIMSLIEHCIGIDSDGNVININIIKILILPYVGQKLIDTDTQIRLLNSNMISLIQNCISIDTTRNVRDIRSAINALVWAWNKLDVDIQIKLLNSMVSLIQSSISIDTTENVRDIRSAINALDWAWNKLDVDTQVNVLKDIVSLIQNYSSINVKYAIYALDKFAYKLDTDILAKLTKTLILSCNRINAAKNISNAKDLTKVLSILKNKLKNQAELSEIVIPLSQYLKSVNSAKNVKATYNRLKGRYECWDYLDTEAQTELLKDIVSLIKFCSSISVAGNIYDADTAIYAFKHFKKQLCLTVQAELLQDIVSLIKYCSMINSTGNIHDANIAVLVLHGFFNELDVIIRTELAIDLIKDCRSIDSGGNVRDAYNAIKILNIFRHYYYNFTTPNEYWMDLNIAKQTELLYIVRKLICNCYDYDSNNDIRDAYNACRALKMFWGELNANEQEHLIETLIQNFSEHYGKRGSNIEMATKVLIWATNKVEVNITAGLVIKLIKCITHLYEYDGLSIIIALNNLKNKISEQTRANLFAIFLSTCKTDYASETIYNSYGKAIIYSELNMARYPENKTRLNRILIASNRHSRPVLMFYNDDKLFSQIGIVEDWIIDDHANKMLDILDQFVKLYDEWLDRYGFKQNK